MWHVFCRRVCMCLPPLAACDSQRLVLYVPAGAEAPRDVTWLNQEVYLPQPSSAAPAVGTQQGQQQWSANSERHELLRLVSAPANRIEALLTLCDPALLVSKAEAASHPWSRGPEVASPWAAAAGAVAPGAGADIDDEGSIPGLVSAAWDLVQSLPTSKSVLQDTLRAPGDVEWTRVLAQPHLPWTAYIMQSVAVYLQPPLDPDAWESSLSPSAWAQAFAECVR